MDFRYSPEQIVDRMYLDIQIVESEARDFLNCGDYDSAIKRANIVLDELKDLETNLRKHPNELLLRKQIKNELRGYKNFADSIKMIAGRKLNRSPERISEEAESIESIAFWEQTYREAHTKML